MLDQAAYLEGGGANWNVSTDGLRNISGQINADGSFTIYGTTSTVSNELTHDLGADRNEIVSITIGAGSNASNTSFSVLETADVGLLLFIGDVFSAVIDAIALLGAKSQRFVPYRSHNFVHRITSSPIRHACTWGEA